MLLVYFYLFTVIYINFLVKLFGIFFFLIFNDLKLKFAVTLPSFRCYLRQQIILTKEFN